MKLAKLPDRTPVRMNLVLAPSLAKRLREYADFYAETYGSKEEVAELIPFMLEAFLDSDADYKSRQKDDKRKKSSRLDCLQGLREPANDSA
ncbi:MULTISPECIES: DUF2274 domain-containing protein [Bradyrhizobium]|jgi:hypothetical protein|uniref:DUF2274 domain-containing protein n=1 Tax=Bradyrhizobium TaxID=374 RepID=UPI000688A73E|nr:MULTISPECIES: DUF2274 domain-containing protein [Bradyrhizobium]MCS3448637.1 hypothetical protein [Bradyrhizobium elkanii]MCS3560219.1 hypothetical protein [Bradyrhizobium elkanii]MCW2149934.1 hypothetical protein [Bradyrhizobium elkanii]MCW2360094.1 hypothetical protein [Bradyrhizobium elkanii]MCW2373666.1 hypothetical protein [Bradyrhizobium elkanii]